MTGIVRGLSLLGLFNRLRRFGSYLVRPTASIRFNSRASLGVVNRYVGNLQPTPRVLLDYPSSRWAHGSPDLNREHVTPAPARRLCDAPHIPRFQFAIDKLHRTKGASHEGHRPQADRAELMSVSRGVLKEIFQSAVNKILGDVQGANNGCVDGFRPPRDDNDIYRLCH